MQKKGKNYLKIKNTLKKLPASCHIKVKKGNIIIINTPGGGGYGKLK